MILKKMIIEGKEIYSPITLEEAVNFESSELVFTASFDQEAYEKAKNSGIDPDEVIDERPKNLDDKVREFSYKVEDALNKAFDYTKDSFKNIGKAFENTNKKKINNIIAVLPFMDDEDIKELMEQILNDDELVKDLPIVSILPFLNEEDCDKLFLKALDGKRKIDVVEIAPFVSEACLDKVVDRYISGEITINNLDGLYPFLSRESTKKIFRHLIK